MGERMRLLKVAVEIGCETCGEGRFLNYCHLSVVTHKKMKAFLLESFILTELKLCSLPLMLGKTLR